MPNNHIFTSESVSEGHPDKVADQISDAVLDAILEKDTHARVAVETMVKTGMVIIAGEVTPPRRLRRSRSRDLRRSSLLPSRMRLRNWTSFAANG